MATGHIRTDRPERYVKQLAGHWREKATVEVEPTSGATTFTMASGARATLHVGEGEVVIDAGTREFGDVVARHLEGFGRKDELTTTWD